VLAFSSSDSPEKVSQQVQKALNSEGITVLGTYRPGENSQAWVLAFTSPELITAVKKLGGLAGFGAALHGAIVREDGTTNFTYQNPEYWLNAYFQKNYPQMAGLVVALEKRLEAALENLGGSKASFFGSEEGLTTDKLRHYHYMFGMEYFEDAVELADFPSYQTAIAQIDRNLNSADQSISLVFSLEIPEQETKLYGIALKGPTGEGYFLPIIDSQVPHHYAAWPYELLVTGNKAVMLHGRFRIALSYPDLTMMTFGKIMSTPSDIESLLKKVCIEKR